MKVGVLGAGSWGAALANHLEKNGHEVTLWGHREERMNLIRETRMIGESLPGLRLPESIEVTSDFSEIVREKELLVFAVPSTAIRETARKIALLQLTEEELRQKTIVSVAKGIEESTLLRLSQVIAEELPLCQVAVLCGPSHAEEVAQSLPTALVAGASEQETAERIQNVFMNEYLRVYTSPDLIGMELGGLFSGSVLTETVFAWPGVGKYIVDGINNSDYAVVQGGCMLVALISVVMNLLVDLLYGTLDPRIRY